MSFKQGLNLRVIPVVSNYTATVFDDVVNANATSGNITVTLPSAALCIGKEITVIKTDSSANTVTVNNSVTNDLLVLQNSPVTVASNGSTWGSVSGTLVAAIYTQTNVQTIGAAILNYDTKVLDTHTAVVVGASWTFTCPAGQGGLYFFNGEITTASLAWVTGDSGATIRLVKNGAQTYIGPSVNMWSSLTVNISCTVTGLIQLAPADTLWIVDSITRTGGAITTNANVKNDFINILKVR